MSPHEYSSSLSESHDVSSSLSESHESPLVSWVTSSVWVSWVPIGLSESHESSSIRVTNGDSWESPVVSMSLNEFPLVYISLQ